LLIIGELQNFRHKQT